MYEIDDDNDYLGFNYDNKLYIACEESDECNDEFMKYDTKNLLYYVQDINGTCKMKEEQKRF